MITIQQEALYAALNAITRASLKSSLAAFALVRLDVKTDGILSLSCFNGETAARAITSVACDEDISLSVDAQTLKAVVETLASEIRLTVEHNSLVIQSSTNRTTLRLVDESIPVLSDENAPALATLTGTTLRSLSRAMAFASSDNSRPVLQVLHLTFTKDTVIAQSADGYSAGYISESIEGPADQTSLSLPLSFARLLSSLVEARDTIRICSLGDNRYIFQIRNLTDSKDLTLATVTSAENFPSEQIMNLIHDARNSTAAYLNVQQTSLMQSIRMVNAMGTQNAFVKAVDGVVKIASSETDTGQARNILEGTVSGENAAVWLSATFLKRAADACKGEVIMRIADGKRPILIEAGNFTAVIMPMMMEVGKDPFPDDEAIAISLPEMAAA